MLLETCNARWDLGIELPVLVLTHDIESEDDFNRIERIARIEEKYGFRSLWNFVPKRYRINKKILYDLLDLGHEIGLHGIWHDNREAFLSEKRKRDEFRNLVPLLREFRIKCYRSPAWFRTKTMFKVLSDFFPYDLSCLDNDLICPAGSGGVGFMRPFRLDSGLVEFPCTLPFEAPLYLGVPPEGLLQYWKPKIEFVKASYGMLLVTTHPTRNYLGNESMLAVYESLLKGLSEENWRMKMPYQLAEDLDN